MSGGYSSIITGFGVVMENLKSLGQIRAMQIDLILPGTNLGRILEPFYRSHREEGSVA